MIQGILHVTLQRGIEEYGFNSAWRVRDTIHEVDPINTPSALETSHPA